MKNLSNISPARGSNRKKRRLGRGIGSNWGKTAGKGHKGQKARSGGKITPGFEGGQTPLYRRVPKRGFRNPFKLQYNIVNIEVLNRFEDNTTVTSELLAQSGLISTARNPVKLLGRGELKKALKVKLDKVSQSARDAVQKAGGSIEEK